MEPKSFSDMPGLPANEHAKKLAKEKSSKKSETQEDFYTIVGDKVKHVAATARGLKTLQYIGKKSKMGAKQFQDFKQMQLAREKWVEEHELEEKSAQIVKRLSNKRG